MIVVDTNVIAYFLIPGDRTAGAERLYQRDPDWLAPTLWRHEFLSVLSLYVRKGLLTLDQAGDLDRQASTDVIRSHLRATSRRILELAYASGCSSYDCEFVALAQEMSLPLVTVDQRVLRAFPGLAVSIDEYLARP